MKLTNYFRGHEAENRAAKYLKTRGFKIVQLNWKTPACEIDIVAEKDRCMYFVEVKSRSSSAFGTGFDYITSKKLRHMRRAAEMWVQKNSYNGEYTLSALSVVGETYELIDSIDI